MPIDDDQRPVPASDHRLEELDGEFILYHPGGTRMVYCNATAGLVWALCDGQRTVGGIRELLAGAYPAAREQVLADVDAVLTSLIEAEALALQ
jgi:hypothetical protein